MKLAEALQERSDLNTAIRQLETRLINNAVYQEGSEPAEDPAELLKELDCCTDRLASLIAQINLTNSKTVKNGKTITELIALRDTIQLKLSVYRNLNQNAVSASQPRYTRSEIRTLSAVNIREQQKKIDEMSKQFRLIDSAIQQLNWETELLSN